jgi:hypothetical protein
LNSSLGELSEVEEAAATRSAAAVLADSDIVKRGATISKPPSPFHSWTLPRASSGRWSLHPWWTASLVQAAA